MGPSRSLTSCFCWASKLLSGTSEAPQAVSIGLRNRYLARVQLPLKLSKPSKPSQQLSTAFRCFAMDLFLLGFETAIWHFRSATSCFYWASKLLSGTCSAPLKTFKSFRRPFAALPWDLPRPHELFLLGFETAIWHFRSATSCFYSGLRNCYLARFQLKTLKGFKTLAAALTAFRCFAMELFLLGFETAIWHFRGATSCFYGRFSAPLKTVKTLKTLPAAFDGLSLL